MNKARSYKLALPALLIASTVATVSACGSPYNAECYSCTPRTRSAAPCNVESPEEAHISESTLPRIEAPVEIQVQPLAMVDDAAVYHELDIPLSNELQMYIYDLCEKYDMPYTLVIAVIERESCYQPDVISVTDDYGLMQINSINHETLSGLLGVTDFLDPLQNVSAGVYMLGSYYQKYGDSHLALMAYSLGETGARRRWEKGEYATPYTESVVAIMERLEQST